MNVDRDLKRKRNYTNMIAISLTVLLETCCLIFFLILKSLQVMLNKRERN